MRKQNLRCAWIACAVLLLAALCPAPSHAQGDTLLARPDFQNWLFDPAPAIPGAPTLQQATSVTLVSGGIWAAGAAGTPSDGQINLVQSIIGQPMAPAAFWYLAPAPLPIHSRFPEERLTVYSAVDGSGRFRNHYTPMTTLVNQEHAAYVKVSTAANPTLELLNWDNETVLSSSNGVSGESLLLFPYSASANYALRVSNPNSGEGWDYELGLYPVVRPGQAVSGELTAAGPVDAVQGAGYYARDYLLWEMSRGQTVKLRLESAGFDGKLEVVSLSQPTNVLITAEPGSGGGDGVTNKAQVEFQNAENCLVRVTSGTARQTGSYRLVVERKLPVVTGFSPSGTNVGGTVVLRGDFYPAENKPTTWVGFGGGVWVKPTSPNIQPGTITVQVPVGAVSGKLVVTNWNGSFTSTEVFQVGSDRPQIRALSFGANGQFNMEISGVAGGRVVIETTTNLTQSIQWLPVVTNQIPVSGTLLQTMTITNRIRQQFYRTRNE